MAGGGGVGAGYPSTLVLLVVVPVVPGVVEEEEEVVRPAVDVSSPSLMLVPTDSEPFSTSVSARCICVCRSAAQRQSLAY
jgi:hypothetical protein